jgi:ribosomal-protein-alanine N-acetyltransferase
MNYKFVEMNDQYAKEIVDWHYDGTYSFYDIRADQEDLEEFMDSSNWSDKYFAVLDKTDVLIGFFSFPFTNGVMSIGLGMKPSLTGKGLGEEFIKMGIDYYKQNTNGGEYEFVKMRKQIDF